MFPCNDTFVKNWIFNLEIVTIENNIKINRESLLFTLILKCVSLQNTTSYSVEPMTDQSWPVDQSYSRKYGTCHRDRCLTYLCIHVPPTCYPDKIKMVFVYHIGDWIESCFFTGKITSLLFLIDCTYLPISNLTIFPMYPGNSWNIWYYICHS